MFKVYVQCDKFSFQNERGFLVVAEEGEFFFVHQVVPEDTQRKQKKTSRSKQGKYVRISGAVRSHYLFQDANNFRELSSRKTVRRIAKLNRGYC